MVWVAEHSVAFAAIVGSVIAAFVSFRTNRRTTRVEQSKVDAEAYDRAQKIYDGAIERLERDNARLQTTVERLEGKTVELEEAMHAVARQDDERIGND